MIKNIISLLILISLFGCETSTSTQSDAKLGEKFEIKFGQQRILSDENISVEFVDVIEDSRCPEGVTCVWAGNAQIAIRLNQTEANLNTYLDPKSAAISGYNIKLIAVNPYPEYQVKVQKEEYTTELLIVRDDS